MADADSVGKIGLDLEIQGDDLDKQIERMANSIGNKISKSLEGITGKFDFNSITKGISDSLNRAMDVIDKTISSSVDKNKANIIKTIEEIKSKALDAIRNIMDKSKGIKIPMQFSPVSNITMPSQSVNREVSSRGPPKSSNVNLESIKAQIENLTNSLDITNRKIEQQQEKLSGLRQAYNSTFNQARKNKIEEQILKTEMSINKLIAQSDKAGFRLADLDAEFERLSSSANKSTNSVNLANNSINKVGNSAKSASSRLKSTNNSTKQYRENMNGARSATGMFIDSMFKWGIVFPIVMKGISAVGSYIGSALMTNAQFSNSLQQIRTNLIVAFMPIYQAVLPALNALMSALANITAYIAAFISAIFGKTYQASFGAAQSMNASIASMESMEKQSKKTSGAVDKIGDSAEKTKKKINGALAGFDEINKLSTPDDSDKKPKNEGGGVDPIPLVAPNIDLSPTSAAMQKINEMVEKLKDIISKIFQPFKNAWEREGVATIASMQYALHGIWEVIKSIGSSFLEVWTNGTGEEILVVILQILQNILNIIGDIAITFANAWNAGGIGTSIVQSLANAFLNVLTIIKHIGDSLRQVWGEVGPSVAATFMQILNATSGVLENLTQKLIYVWDNGGSHLFQGFIRLGAKVFELAGYIYVNFVAPLVNWFVDMIAPAIAKLADILGVVLDAFSNLIGWLLGDGKPVLDVMIITVTTFFAAWEVAKLLSFIQQAGGVVSALGNLGTALKNCTLAKLSDKAETAMLTLTYAKDFVVSLAKGTLELVKQAGQFLINTGLKIADTTAQIAMTAATVAWNAVCVIATTVTTALGAAIAFLTSPIGIAILAITAIIAVGVALYRNWDFIKEKAIEIWGKIKDIFNRFKEWLRGVFQTDWSNCFGVLGNLLNAFLSSVKSIFSGVRQIFGGIIDFVVGIFTGNWERAWNGVVNIFKGIFNMLGGIAKAPLNAVIGLVNMCIDGLNKISFTAPDWVPLVGGKHFGVNLPKMPYLAKGGIVDKPTQAVVGEAGAEAVVPLENNTGGLDLLANKLFERINKMLLMSIKSIQQPNLTMLGQNVESDNKNNMLDSENIKKLKEAIIEAINDTKDDKVNNDNKDKEIKFKLEFNMGTLKFAKTICTSLNKLGESNGGVIPINL